MHATAVPFELPRRSPIFVGLPGNDEYDLAGVYTQALNKIRQGLCVFDREQRLLLFNPQYAEMYDLNPADLWLGMTLRDVIDLRYAAGTGPQMPSEEYAVWRDRIGVENRVVETVVELRNGKVHEIHHEPRPEGGWVATFDDITERRRNEELISHMARHDALTGLPNRHVFHERLELSFAQTGRGAHIAVLFLDLDRFKPVNDTYGHLVGDLLLRSVSKRICSQVRGGDTVTRLGGDEFAVLQVGIENRDDAAKLATRVIGSVAGSHSVDDYQVSVGTSVGIALAPMDGSSPEVLLKHADIALYRAKKRGGNNFEYFNAEGVS